MKISITQKDIDCGIRCNAYACFTVVALERLGFIEPACHGYIFFTKDGKRWSVKTPKLLFDKIKIWDRGGTIAPFDFELDLSNPVEEPMY